MAAILDFDPKKARVWNSINFADIFYSSKLHFKTFLLIWPNFPDQRGGGGGGALWNFDRWLK